MDFSEYAYPVGLMHDPSQVFDQAADLHRKGELAAAADLYLQLIAARPDHFDSLQMLGLLRYQQGRLPEALSSMGAALRANPNFPPALLNYAVMLDTLGRREEALAHYDRALAIQPDYAEAIFNRGVVLRHLRRPAEALASFNSVLAIRPDDADAHGHRGNALRDLKRPAEAVASYDRALSIRSDDSDVLNNRGNALRDLDRIAEALLSYDRALASKPDHVGALNNRASALRSLKRPAEALASYDRALAINPQDAGAFYNRGNALQDLERHAEALASYDKALAIRPDYVEALIGRGVSLTSLARCQDALKVFDQALALRPGSTGALSNKAKCLVLLGRYDQALVAYDQLLASEPGLAEAWLDRGGVLNFHLQRHADALAAFDKALAIKPDSADAWLGRGEALAGMGETQRAAAAYRKALASGGDPGSIKFALAALGAAAAPASAPRDGVIKLFDQYAGHFDGHLVGELKYRTPDSLLEAIEGAAPSGGLDIVDLGCGTGLVGLRFRSIARTLTGVDLSSRMIEVARQRQIYDNLVCSDLTDFLHTQGRNFDVAIAADVFVYIGDLSVVFHAVGAVLRKGGLFGFSAEVSQDRDFVLRPSRRYAHSKAYLQRLAQSHGFEPVSIDPHVIRQQGGIDVAGHLVLLRARAGAVGAQKAAGA